ncbi:MAG TPA: hypothetical protein VM864_14225 [Pyrinomonadaceae bacterium]|nr:hypothetical protein [Pyrinomonadaceae bacterium]
MGAGGSDYPNRPAPPPPGAPGPAPVEGDNEETLDEPPIIIQGGGSVLLNIPTKFKEKGTNKGGGKYKNEVQDLISIQIDNNEPILLDVDATIVITCGARAKK